MADHLNTGARWQVANLWAVTSCKRVLGLTSMSLCTRKASSSPEALYSSQVQLRAACGLPASLCALEQGTSVLGYAASLCFALLCVAKECCVFMISLVLNYRSGCVIGGE